MDYQLLQLQKVNKYIIYYMQKHLFFTSGRQCNKYKLIFSTRTQFLTPRM